MSTDHSREFSPDAADADRFVFRAEPDQPLSEAVIVAVATQRGRVEITPLDP